eukprot:jgi/Chrzof1/7654/Cz02g31220.t1
MQENIVCCSTATPADQTAGHCQHNLQDQCLDCSHTPHPYQPQAVHRQMHQPSCATANIEYAEYTTQGGAQSAGQPSDSEEEVTVKVKGPTGDPIEHWDLHVGAQLDILGKMVVLKKANLSTQQWLDGQAGQLLAQKRALEAEVAKFAPVIHAGGLLPSKPQRSEPYGIRDKDQAPLGGKVNLRHLREDITLLAARLRQHKAHVPLAPEFKDLLTEGPDDWSLESQTPHSFASKTPTRALCSRLLTRSYTDANLPSTPSLPTLGETPNALSKLTALNRVNLSEWIDSIPLAASAARDKRCLFVATDTPTGNRLGPGSCKDKRKSGRPNLPGEWNTPGTPGAGGFQSTFRTPHPPYQVAQR